MKTTFCLLLMLMAQLLSAQTATPGQTITVHGYLFDIGDSMAKPAPIVVNKRTGTGQTAAAGTMFSITGLKSDTFLVTAGGYNVVHICFADSLVKDIYTVRIGLRIKETMMKAVAIYPVKDLDAIRKERAGLGVRQTATTEGTTEALESPITYLYDHFSREGRSKAAVAMLENEDKKQEVLKELFRTYVRAGVIDLQEDEFDNFIRYLNIPEAVLKTASDYDLAVFIRQRYLMYRNAEHFHNQNQR